MFDPLTACSLLLHPGISSLISEGKEDEWTESKKSSSSQALFIHPTPTALFCNMTNKKTKTFSFIWASL